MTLCLAAAPAQAGDLDHLYRKHGAAHGVDWRLLKAIAIVESRENPRAVNRRDPSVGVMQILCRPHGAVCGNRLDVPGCPPARERLFDPDFNIGVGARILAANIRAYGRDKGVAVYNSWAAHRTRRDRKFPNQDYVDRVLREYRALAPDTPAGGGANNTRSAGRPTADIATSTGDRAVSPTLRAFLRGGGTWPWEMTREACACGLAGACDCGTAHH